MARYQVQMDNIYKILYDKGYKPIYNKYDNEINAQGLRIRKVYNKYKPRSIYHVVFFKHGGLISEMIYLSNKSSVVDVVNNLPRIK